MLALADMTEAVAAAAVAPGRPWRRRTTASVTGRRRSRRRAARGGAVSTLSAVLNVGHSICSYRRSGSGSSNGEECGGRNGNDRGGRAHVAAPAAAASPHRE